MALFHFVISLSDFTFVFPPREKATFFFGSLAPRENDSENPVGPKVPPGGTLGLSTRDYQAPNVPVTQWEYGTETKKSLAFGSKPA